MKKLLFAILISIPTFFWGQQVYNHQTDVFEASEITFYGYDFSHFKLAEGKRTGEDIKSYIVSWIGFMNEEWPEKSLRHHLKNDDVKFSFAYTQSILLELNNEDLVSYFKHEIPQDSIQRILNKYQIDEKEGIGFVVIVECFEKNTETAYAHFVFFDINSKKVIMADHFGFKSDAWAFGMIKFWGTKFDKLFDKYFSKIYNNRFKEIVL